MPWITLELDEVADGAHVAPALAGAVAQALELAPSDVLVSVRGRAAVFDGRGRVPGWPAATLHGRARDPEAMARAQRAAAAALAHAQGCDADRVWVHWCVA